MYKDGSGTRLDAQGNDSWGLWIKEVGQDGIKYNVRDSRERAHVAKQRTKQRKRLKRKEDGSSTGKTRAEG